MLTLATEHKKVLLLGYRCFCNYSFDQICTQVNVKTRKVHIEIFKAPALEATSINSSTVSHKETAAKHIQTCTVKFFKVKHTPTGCQTDINLKM